MLGRERYNTVKTPQDTVMLQALPNSLLGILTTS